MRFGNREPRIANRVARAGARDGRPKSRFPVPDSRFAAAFVAALLFFSPASAVEPDEVLADPALEARAREVSRDLRCVVCQSQSIDDSNAPLARDLRLLVRERIVAGDTNDETKAYVVARYGEFVLLKPPFSAGAIALWAAPAAVLALAGLAGFLALRRPEKPALAPLSAEEEARLKDIA